MLTCLIITIVLLCILRPILRKDITRQKKAIDACDTLPIYHQAKLHKSRTYRKALKNYVKRNQDMVDYL